MLVFSFWELHFHTPTEALPKVARSPPPSRYCRHWAWPTTTAMQCSGTVGDAYDYEASSITTASAD